jgi:hypothetical protein
MQNLNDDYKERLQAVAEVIQGSDELAAYLDEESHELYKVLQDTYEPLVAEIYQEVAENDPLQIKALEQVLLNPYFEGLFLPRILGYSVLRGEVNDELKYTRPQEDFKKVLHVIASSANFDQLKQRIGQTVQVGFSLSSEIWITNLLEQIENKKVRAFLQSMRHDRFRDLNERRNLLERYKKQFSHYNFYTAEFPDTINELKVEFSALRSFLLNRIKFKSKHDSYTKEIHEIISKKQFSKEKEYLELVSIIAHFIDLNETETVHLKTALNACRSENPSFNQYYFQFLKRELKQRPSNITPEADKKFSSLLDRTNADDLVRFYNIIDTIHSKGFIHEDVLDGVNAFYSQYEGMSINNECLRLSISNLFYKVVSNLSCPEYHAFFELNKTFGAYINIFSNSAFSQDVENMCMDYVNKLLAFYKDKRSKEYQEIKKLVSSNFTELEFLSDKELVELFKIKRKKKED